MSEIVYSYRCSCGTECEIHAESAEALEVGKSASRGQCNACASAELDAEIAATRAALLGA